MILLHPFPLVCGAGPLGAGIYDDGVFGCFGIERISRIASETPERGSATSRGKSANIGVIDVRNPR